MVRQFWPKMLVLLWDILSRLWFDDGLVIDLAQSTDPGARASAIFFMANIFISSWFQKNRASAIGVASSGSSIGGIILP
jgi:hypothetical protein